MTEESLPGCADFHFASFQYSLKKPREFDLRDRRAGRCDAVGAAPIVDRVMARRDHRNEIRIWIVLTPGRRAIESLR